MCVCLPPRLLISSGVILTPYNRLNKFYNFSLAAVFRIVSECGLSIDEHHTNQPNVSNLVFHKLLLYFNSN